MSHDEVIPHLFRTEYSKIVAVLCRRFGFDQIETAEDIASETFLTASQVWGVQNVPPNPTGWLYQVAKNKAKNLLQRRAVFDSKVAPELQKATQSEFEVDLDLSTQNIADSQLQMMFAVCHPCLPAEAQVGLALRFLCGFGIQEIADAFLTGKETINKRLQRAKDKLRQEKVEIVFPPPSELDGRLDSVLTTIYLLFNEGYHSMSQSEPLRKDLCLEAIRLCILLVENDATNRPRVNALLALMCFHTSRFDARLGESGELILYDEQDASQWNADLIAKGAYFLKQAAKGNTLSKYHLEAGIAFWHTQKEDTQEKWEAILQLYNQLLTIGYSPMAALNRTYALARVHGKSVAIKEAEKLKLDDHHLYHALLGELYTGIDRHKAESYLLQAMALAKTAPDKLAIEKKIAKL